MDKVSEAREKLKNCKRQDETAITLSKREWVKKDVIYLDEFGEIDENKK